MLCEDQNEVMVEDKNEDEDDSGCNYDPQGYSTGSTGCVSILVSTPGPF
jgi:hypothetical protein